MPVHIVYVCVRREDNSPKPYFFATPEEFAVGYLSRDKPDDTWVQARWFWTWLEWQLMIRRQKLPRRLQKYANADTSDYLEKIRQQGIDPLTHNPFLQKVAEHSFIRRYKEAARGHAIRFAPQQAQTIDLSQTHFNDIQYIIAATLEKKKGCIFCPECDAGVAAKVMSRRIENYHGAGGRSFWCDKGHPLFYTFDWIS